MKAAPVINSVHNTLVITGSGKIIWNDTSVSLDTLAGILASTINMRPEPEFEFRPESTADYDIVDKVMAVIKRSGITKWGFVGNEAY